MILLEEVFCIDLNIIIYRKTAVNTNLEIRLVF